jgi:parallel beta-helix repeat protein
MSSLVDIEGRPRIVDGRYSGTAITDIGAYEFDPARPAIALSPAFIEFVREPDGPNPASQPLKIRNPAGGSLNWRIEEQCPWLSASPANGTSEGQVAEITLSVDTSQLSQGFYQCGVSVTDLNASNDPREIVVRLLVKGELLVPQKFATIQGAVNAAMTGETIIVSEGVYEEYVTVDKELTLLGVGGPTIVGLRLTADGCTVDGFVLTGAGTGLTVSSSDNTITNNSVVGNQYGVMLAYNSAHNTLINNEIRDNTLQGMSISYSRLNTLRDNSISGSALGFELTGGTLQHYQQDIDISNTVDGKPIYYLVGETGTVVDSGSNASCVFAVNCTGLTIRDLTLSGNHRGVCLVSTDNSRIENVVAQDNEEAGIWLEQSYHNELIGNTACGSVYGIVLFGSGVNTLTSNACRDNEYNFWCRGDGSDDYLQTIDVSNTVDGKPIYYLVGQVGTLVDSTTNAGCVYAVDCCDVTVRDLTLGHNGIGVAFVGTAESRIERVACADHIEAGILLRECSDVSLADCDSSYNETGIVAYGGAGIQIERTRVASNLAGVGFMGSRQAKLLNSIIMGNSRSAAIAGTTSETWGGVLVDDDGDLTVVNCTIHGNAGGSYSYGYESGGITCNSSADSLTVLNSIVWANRPQQISISYSGVSRGGRGAPVPQGTAVRYCDVQGGFDGVGNIDEAPRITCTGHLQIGSPCIDRGDPNAALLSQEDIDGEARVSGVAVDIGADEYMDRDQDGLPDWWETEFFLDPNAAEPDTDPDGDAHGNLDEYRWYASDPTVPCNVLYVDAALGNDANDGYTRESAKKSIQAAIKAAANSDRVLVAPGVYQENVGLLGRQIILQSNDPADRDIVTSTVVKGAVYLTNGELPGCIVDGLTISASNSSYWAPYSQVGLTCSGSSPMIRRCVITGFQSTQLGYENGVAVACSYASPTISQCTISDNWVTQRASIIRLDSSSAELRNCLICGNESQYGYDDGQVIRLVNSKLRLSNCTIAHNGAPEQYGWGGSALYGSGSELLVANSILWNDVYREIAGDGLSAVKVMYSDVRLQPQYGLSWSYPGEGNMSVDPCFVAPGYWSPSYSRGWEPRTWIDGDYHLKSQGWRWSPALSHGTHWVWDEQTSLCIDAGNPGSPLAGEFLAVPGDLENEFGRNVRINMGAYGGRPEASMAPPGWALQADLTNDGTVNFADLEQWDTYAAMPGDGLPGDLNRDGDVDMTDFAFFALDWGATTPWFGTLTALTPAGGGATPPPKGRACFVADTLVWVSGHLAHISKVTEGQTIGKQLAGTLSLEQVQEHEGTFLCRDIALETGNMISVVDAHCFMLDSGQWVAAQNLTAGLRLKTLTGAIGIRNITTRSYAGKVYNLKIAGSDQYMVGKDAVIVRDY